MAKDFLQGTSSATELLTETESLRSLFRVRRDVKKTAFVAAAVVLVIIVSIIIGVACRPHSAGQQGAATPNAIMARLAAADISFDRGNGSAPGGPGSLSAGASLRNRTRRVDDDYRELDKI